jgi:alpha-beta hydrolase superfamily lysophospholipase
MKRHAIRLLHQILLLALWVFTIGLTVLIVNGMRARKGPPLRSWQTVHLEEEFTADDAPDCPTLADYLAIEEKVFAELDEKIIQNLTPSDRPLANRYARPLPAGLNWNRTIEWRPETIRGGVLMLHGLSDAPYSMKYFAEEYQRNGYMVLALRMPGHGTIPTGILHANTKDWIAATEIGARHILNTIGPNRPFHIVGYSNGGALALHHTLRQIEAEQCTDVDRLILISPMIGVSSAAKYAILLDWMGRIPAFEKSRWLDLMPEYLAYKYNSFPAMAGYQSYIMSTAVQQQLARLSKTEALAMLPPILTFQSIVDATVSTRTTVDALYDHLKGNENELVLFNLNTSSGTSPFIKGKDLNLGAELFKDRDRHYRLTVIANRKPESREVVEYSAPADTLDFATHDLDLEWPKGIYSLSHVALPMPPEDAEYGANSPLGLLAPHGEKNVLNVPVGQIMRIMYNPFYSYLEEKLISWVGSDFQPDEAHESSRK